METSCTLKLNRSYMSEGYDEAHRYGSKWFIAEKIIGALLIVLGLALFYYANGKTVLPLAFVFLGTLELASSKIKKFFWLRRHKKSKLSDAEVKMSFSESGIESSSPFSTSSQTWPGIEKCIRTPNGVLV